MTSDIALRKAPPFHLTLAHLVIGGALVFVAGNLVFAMSLRLLPGAILSLGCLGATFVILHTASRNSFHSTPVHLPFFALCMATGFALCLLAGQGHFFYAIDDWLMRDAVLADLSVSALPAYSWDQEAFIMRAPLGMYLLPGALGRLAGLGAAHGLMFVQNACLAGCALYLIAEAFERRRPAFLALFIFFSGLDVIGLWTLQGIDWLPMHLENWHPQVQYYSFISQMFWSPNHFLPGWWFAALLALHLRGGGLAPVLFVLFAAALIWSPLTMMGALPFVIFVILREPRKMMSPDVIRACLAGAAFLPVAIYLQLDAASVEQRWLLKHPEYTLLFLGIEIPHVAFIVTVALNRAMPWSRVLALSIVLLLLIPLYSIGVNNDFSLHASIVSLMFLAACFVSRVLELSQLKDPIRFFAWTIIVIGAVNPVVGILRNIRVPSYGISVCDLASSWNELGGGKVTSLNQYMVRVDRMPDWLAPPPQSLRPRSSEAESCWPDHPFVVRASK